MYAGGRKIQMTLEEPEILRVHRTREEARTTYDRLSRWYDLLEGIWEKKARDQAIRMLAAKPAERVLEIGAGTGLSLEGLTRPLKTGGSLYDVDLSPRMLDRMMHRARRLKLADRVRLVLGDAEHLPLARASIDAVFMSFVLELFDTPVIPTVLANCRTTLRVGGRICIVSLSRAGGRSLIRNIYERGHIAFPSFLDCRPIFVRESLHQAGFRIEEAIRSSLWGLPIEIVLGRKPSG